MSTFSWKKLRDELAVSKFLSPEDDLKTQRGIVAAAAAIMDRMSNSERMREVTWQPVRLATIKTVQVAAAAPAAVASPPQASNGKGKRKGKGDDPNGNSLILKPEPAPILPGPAPAYADIVF